MKTYVGEMDQTFEKKLFSLMTEIQVLLLLMSSRTDKHDVLISKYIFA